MKSFDTASAARFLAGGFLLLPAVLCGQDTLPVGTQGRVGCLENPKVVERLEITRSGVYENYLVDSAGQGGNRVKITADDVILRNCEIRNASGNGIGVFGTNVTIENCHIHHLLAGSFEDQKDAHGITGRWGNVTIRNCEIHHISGDCIQFDPDRVRTGNVTVENCSLWTGPLPEDAAAFRKGQRPGENALDTKTPEGGERCTLTIRNCHMYGWKQPASIGNMAALNLKENVAAEVTNCVIHDCEIALRLRGPGNRGSGALVVVRDCAIHDSGTGVRGENGIEDLSIHGLLIGEGVEREFHFTDGGPGAGFVNEGQGKAPPLEEVLRTGLR